MLREHVTGPGEPLACDRAGVNQIEVGREAVGTACAKARWQEKSKYSRGTGPAGPEGKEGPEMRPRSKGEFSSVEMMLLIMADAVPLPMEEFNT